MDKGGKNIQWRKDNLFKKWCSENWSTISKRVRKQQLELDMEQQTSSKSRKQYIKAVYCHSVYLTYMQNTS